MTSCRRLFPLGKPGGSLIPIVLAAAILFPGSAFPAGVELPVNGISVATDIGVLATRKESFDVTLSIRHAPDIDLVHIGLDYDELMMRFDDSWSFEDTIGSEPYGYYHDDEKGYIEILVPFDPNQGIDEARALIRLKFTLLPPSAHALRYGYRTTFPIQIDDKGTYFLRTQDRRSVPPAAALDGSVTVYYRDCLEIGSAKISPNKEVFRIPVFVTHVQEESTNFTMGLDYDELYLTKVIMVSDLLDQEVRFEPKTGKDSIAWIEFTFKDRIYPKFFREHLIDLEFRFHPGDEQKVQTLKVGDILTITPKALETGGIGGGVETRHGELSIVPPKFIRGDANADGPVDLNDVLSILEFVTGHGLPGSQPPACRDATDADGNGEVDISDPIRILNFLYLAGSPPAAPFPEAGWANEDQELGCEAGVEVFEVLPLCSSM